MRVARDLLTQLWGLLCGAALGAVRTQQAADHLLAKGRLVAAAGVPPLPGAGHWDTLASAAPAGAGGVFFGLSLGLGAGSACAVWCRVCRGLPGPAGRWLPWAVLALPLAAAAAGDLGLAACLLGIAAGALALHRRPEPSRATAWRLALAAVCAAGLVPWAQAPEGPFTRLRDQVLFDTAPGRVLDQFYYRWTLYPAEALKPLAAKTQPLAAPDPQLDPARRDRWCRQARRLGVVCADAAPGAPGTDLTVAAGRDGLELAATGVHRPWPARPADQDETWRGFSEAADTARPLRRATGLALFAGCPLGLAWLLGGAALGFGELCVGARRRLAAAVLAAATAAALGLAGRPDPEIGALRTAAADSPEALSAHLRSPRPAERFYAARAAPRLGARAVPLLQEALGDPLINVRYAAALSLGRIGGPEARDTLVEVLAQPEEWYVKERAYAALRRLGWPEP